MPFIKVNTSGMELTENTHQQVVEALRRLQQKGESLNALADRAGVTRSWLHRLKNDRIGEDAWIRLINTARFIATEFPEEINAPSSTPSYASSVSVRVAPISSDGRSGYEGRV